MDNLKKISVIGTGYVGLTAAVCLATLGFDVHCVDTDHEKIEQLRNSHCPIYEPQLNTLLQEALEKNNLFFTSNLEKAVKNSSIIFITVGTPISDTGQADIRTVNHVAKQLGPLLTHDPVVVLKSTVPVGTHEKVEQLIRSEYPNASFSLVSNPEFLRAGTAIHDFMKPDRIVIGTHTTKAYQTMKELYGRFTQNNVPLLLTDPRSAELIKYLSNAFLATKISFANETAGLCESLDANLDDVLAGIGLDQRIGEHYLKPGPGFGGSCLSKDAQALLNTLKEHNTSAEIIQATLKANAEHKKRLMNKVLSLCSNTHKKIALLGISFKANTDDTRNSFALELAEKLSENGLVIQAYDPAIKQGSKPSLQNLHWKTNLYDCITETSLIVITTEWQEFKELDLAKTYALLSQNTQKPTLVDFRNLYSAEKVRSCGLHYVTLGTKVAKGSEELF